ncbi:MAG: hypothetical protein M3Q88_01220 [Pseudomonadota bacterium]|nr:hypothetical protein [Pseudomonadota bacterium]
MRFGKIVLCLAGVSSIAACDTTELSTRDIERAAVERARERLGLGQDVPLKATVWVGREADGQISYCGSVEGESGATTRIPPQQFAAHGEPLSFFIFGDAHRIVPESQPGMFENWTALCAGTQPA